MTGTEGKGQELNGPVLTPSSVPKEKNWRGISLVLTLSTSAKKSGGEIGESKNR